MTQFDILVLVLLAISALIGFMRGAVREIAAFLALVVAGVLAIVGLPVFAPIMRGILHPGWLAAIAALLGVFGVAFISLRLIGATVARSVQSTHMLGFLDRSVGLLIGLGRGLLVLGVLFLLFVAATPEDLRPPWITKARTWPLARNMGALVERLAPQGMKAANRHLGTAFDRALREGSGDRTTTEGYEAPETANTDRPERSR